eukprot:2361767-Prymnesium_polylepis.1
MYGRWISLVLMLMWVFRVEFCRVSGERCRARRCAPAADALPVPRASTRHPTSKGAAAGSALPTCGPALGDQDAAISRFRPRAPTCT